MKKKIENTYNKLRDIVDKNKNSEAYKRHVKRGVFKGSVAMAIVQLIFSYIIKSSDEKTVIMGLKLSSLVMFGIIFYKHMKGMKNKDMEKGHAVFAFIHIILMAYIVFL